MTAPIAITYTDAPVAYDGFGTRTVALMGQIASSMGLRFVRKVETPAGDVEWQRNRYASGMYLSANPEQLSRVADLIRELGEGKCPFCKGEVTGTPHLCPEARYCESCGNGLDSEGLCPKCAECDHDPDSDIVSRCPS